MAYIIPGLPPRPAPQPGLFTPRGIAASLARMDVGRMGAAARNLRYMAEQDAFRELDDAAEAVRRTCLATHHLDCGCYLAAPETVAARVWRSNFCSLCGGEGRCLPTCEATDARR